MIYLVIGSADADNEKAEIMKDLLFSEESTKGRSSAPSVRRARAVESFGTASQAIGDVTPGMSLFAVTRGQWSMIDAVLHVIDQVGPSFVSLWTWTVAEYEVQVLERLRQDNRLIGGRLVIDHAARKKNASIITQWKESFGDESVRYVVNHSKIATIESKSGLRLLLRGSMNLNFNPRFEQFDITEGGIDFDLVKEIENELPTLNDDCSGAQVYAASKVGDAFAAEELSLFKGAQVWAK